MFRQYQVSFCYFCLGGCLLQNPDSPHLLEIVSHPSPSGDRPSKAASAPGLGGNNVDLGQWKVAEHVEMLQMHL